MSEDKTWLLAPITTRTTKKALEAMISAMPPEYRGDNPDGSYTLPGSQKKDLARFIRDARSTYWNDKRADRQKGYVSLVIRRNPKRRRIPTGVEALSEMPTARAKDFLRNLPDWGKE